MKVMKKPVWTNLQRCDIQKVRHINSASCALTTAPSQQQCQCLKHSADMLLQLLLKQALEAFSDGVFVVFEVRVFYWCSVYSVFNKALTFVTWVFARH